MKKFKKIFLIFICFLLIFSTLQTPVSALAVEIIGGSYVAYAILAAALAAAGYTIATNQVSPEVFQGILDSPNSELIRALIGGTTLYATAKGQVYFNWSSAQWSVFTNWVQSVIASGELVIPYPESEVPVLSTSFNAQTISTYFEKYIPSSDLIIGYTMPGASVNTVIVNNTKRSVEVHLSNCILTSTYSGANFTSDGHSYYFFGSPFYLTGINPTITIGIGVNGAGYRTYDRSQIARASGVITASFSLITYEGVKYYLNRLNSGVIQLVNYMTGVKTAICGTVAYPTTYSSLAQYWTDVINTGALVGDFTGIGEDVINPGLPQIDVGISAYPDSVVGDGIDSLPLDLDIGSSIDIPLDRYIDTPIDISEDPVPIDFTPWRDKTIDTTPEDVIPDIRINPPRDVPANPDIPWADTETYPIDYPIDTDTPLLPDDPNPNTPPSGDDSNKLKLLPLILSKFPFCLPWDLQHGFKSLVVSGSPPVFDIPLRSVSAGIDENIHIDLSRFQTVATVSRWFFSALWVVLLILITRKIVWK